ncbi:unnamed protein product, partial [Allacma fusca]
LSVVLTWTSQSFWGNGLVCSTLLARSRILKLRFITQSLLPHFKKILIHGFDWISTDAMTSGASFFMLAALNRPKAKKVTQVESIKAFIEVINIFCSRWMILTNLPVTVSPNELK